MATALDYRWGKEEAPGTKEFKNSYYSSFFLKNEEIFVSDVVCIRSQDPASPYIGKILRLWENSGDKSKKVKILWFFRPEDINVQGEPKELFIAAGTKPGAQNINLLETIISKCKVVCTATHPLNNPPSESDLRDAEYFFNKCFDVDTQTVKSDFEKLIEQVKAPKLFNRKRPSAPGSSSDAKRAKVGEAPKEIKITKPAEVLQEEKVPEPPKQSMASSQETAKVPEVPKEAHTFNNVTEASNDTGKAPAQMRRIFKKFSWEENLEYCFEKGLVVQLENFGASLTAEDLQEGFRTLFPDVNCEIRVTPKTMQVDECTTGQAVVCFKVKEQGLAVVKALDDDVVVLTGDWRPVVAKPLQPPDRKTVTQHPGHVKTEELRTQGWTSHCAQPNTIEYEMGLKWRTLERQCDMQWESLQKLADEDYAAVVS